MKYKLLRDLPGYGVSIGNVYTGDNGSYRLENGDNIERWLELFIEDFKYLPDWFEPIPGEPTRWRAGREDKFWFIDLHLYADSDLIEFNYGDAENEKGCYKTGNYFRTKEQAQAVADAIKTVLTWVHDPEAEGIRALSDGLTLDMYKALSKAREAVQGKET